MGQLKQFYRANDDYSNWKELKKIMEERGLNELNHGLEKENYIFDEHLTLFINVEIAFKILDMIYDESSYIFNKACLEYLYFLIDYMNQNNLSFEEDKTEEANKRLKEGNATIKMPIDFELSPIVLPKIKKFQEYKKPSQYSLYKSFDDFRDIYIPYFYVLEWCEKAIIFIKDRLSK